MSSERIAAPKLGSGSEVGLRQELKAVRKLGPYLWPRDWGLRARVLGSIVLLVAAKGVNVYVPLLYKGAVDRLSPGHSAAITVPVALIVGYGLARVGAQLFAELRDAVFAKVGQRAVRRVALATFSHLHALSLRFHLDRQTGGLSRAIERGIRGTEFLLSYMLFNVVPTLIEIALVCGILWGFYEASFALATLATILGYIAFTFAVTDWRIKFRREMNERDSEANTKAIDSLLNFETVKYFANEAHEAERFDKALRAYERAAVKSQTTLSALNIGQGIIIAGGLVTVMLLAARGVARGSMTVGDFVLVNSYLVQLYAPLNVLGMVYRNIKQSLTDLESMVRLLSVRAEVTDKPGAPDLAVKRGEIAFERVSFA
ncbi:MAG: ABC transporter transmembrane domain-containing protein, partial [Stellaceae bacterium]